MAASHFSRTAGVIASAMLGAGAVGPLVKSMLVNVQLDDVSEPRAQILLAWRPSPCCSPRSAGPDG